MNLGDIGNFKIGGSINTQFQTSLGIERVMIGLGQQAGGITSFLATLEFVGAILTIFWCVFLITLILAVRVILFLVYIYKYFKYANERKQARANDMTKEEVDKALSRFEVTKEDEDKIRNFN